LTSLKAQLIILNSRGRKRKSERARTNKKTHSRKLVESIYVFYKACLRSHSRKLILEAIIYDPKDLF